MPTGGVPGPRWARAGAGPGPGARDGPLAATGCLHRALDDYPRMVYSEILGDETKETAADLWRRAAAFSASIGVSVQAVMTDNGSCYRWRA